MKIKIGQIWVENSPRKFFNREVEVVEVGPVFVKIRNVVTKRKTLAKLDRFDGKIKNYSLRHL